MLKATRSFSLLVLQVLATVSAFGASNTSYVGVAGSLSEISTVNRVPVWQNLSPWVSFELRSQSYLPWLARFELGYSQKADSLGNLTTISSEYLAGVHFVRELDVLHGSLEVQPRGLIGLTNTWSVSRGDFDGAQNYASSRVNPFLTIGLDFIMAVRPYLNLVPLVRVEQSLLQHEGRLRLGLELQISIE